jgi:hypothetical protein
MLKFNRLVVVYSPDSSRADEYDRKTSHELRQLADTHGAKLVEVLLGDTPYLETMHMVRDSLRDGDVVFGAGGDGVNQTTLHGAFESKRDVTLGFLPLGNANDFATTLNGRIKNPVRILGSPTIDFHPLELLINDRVKFYVAAYATFGITTVAVDWLNSEKTRGDRKRFAKLPPIAALRPGYLGKMSHAINKLKFPAFRCDCLVHHDDSIGFFLTPAAKGVLRTPGANNFLTRDDFFFHFDNVRKKSPGKGWVGKSLVASRWATLGLPGLISDYEKVEFIHTTDMMVHIGGETVNLGKVQSISAERSRHSIKIFAPRKSLQA